MGRRTRAIALMMAALMVFFCTSCMGTGADMLYALPRLSDEYVQLESLIAERIRSGGEYAAPIGGSHRQSVQMHDLDGDGTAEAVAFLADATHTPMVCVYRQNDAGDYYLDVIISGEGSAVSRVEYADVNGDGMEEVIIAWQISGELKLLSVYSLTKDEHTALLSADCAEFFLSDLDGDGTEELLILRSGDGGASRLVRYTFADGSSVSSDAPVSAGVSDAVRVRTGYLSDGAAALFMESRWGSDGLITDVFIAADGALRNITMTSTGRSETQRRGEAYAADMNADRVTEVPTADGDLLRWYSLDSGGGRTLVMTTYHEYGDGWYLSLPDALTALAPSVTVIEAAAGETAAVFSVPTEAGAEPLLTVYTITGDNRLERASEAGRFILAQGEAAVYAAEIADGAPAETKEITEGFNLIYPEWQTGNLG